MPVQFIACKSSGLLVGVECADDNGADNDGGNGDYDSIDKVCVCVFVCLLCYVVKITCRQAFLGRKGRGPVCVVCSCRKQN